MRGRRALEGLNDDIKDHLDRETQDNIDRGMAPDEARRQALVKFGNIALVAEDTRRVWTWTAVEQLLADLRSGLRILTRSPGVSLTAIVLIALVIGGNTIIFSMVHGLLTKPAPAIPESNLVSLGWSVDRQPVHPTDSYANYLDVAAAAQTVRPMLAFRFERFTLTHRDGSYAVSGSLVTPSYFDTLGVTLARGRMFSEDEAQASELTAVISHRLWTEHFQQRDDAIGQRIAVNGHSATIVGIAPARFQGLWLGERSDVWVPLVAYSRRDGAGRLLEERVGGPFAMVGRLARGVSRREAQAELSTIASRLQAAYPAENKRKAIAVFPYSATAAGDSMIAQRGPQFLAVFSVVTAITLLIVCANVANLMLARAVVRQREMAVRRSFGASQLRVIRLVLAEGIAISAAAWAVACFCAWITSKAMARWVPPSEGGAPFVVDFTPDWKVVGYAMVLAVIGTVAFTIGPALRAWRQDVLPFLKAGEQGVVAGRSRLATGLVVLQLAFAVLLLAGAGLVYRSFSLADALDLGFNRDHMLLVTINVDGVPEGTRATLLERMRERLRGVPAVDDVTYARTPPKEYWSSEQVRAAATQQPVLAEQNSVGPDYLRVLGMVPRLGRELLVEDGNRTTTPAAVINEHLAQALWPGGAPVGRTLLLGPRQQPVEVVGVAPNAFFSGFRREERPYFVFLPMRTNPRPSGQATFYVRYNGALDQVAPAIGRALGEVDSRAPIVYLRTMDTQLASIISVIRMLTTMLEIFATVSLLIAILGQYAVLAFAMKRRVREFGLRMALGASAPQILGSVVGEGLRLTVVGLAIGVALSISAARGLRSLLFGVSPSDPTTYIGVVVVLAAASLLACWLPARRAARVDPMEALRQE
jgi:putative ABC transport system permease protein